MTWAYLTFADSTSQEPRARPNLLRRSLTNSSYLVDHKERIAEYFAIKPGAGTRIIVNAMHHSAAQPTR